MTEEQTLMLKDCIKRGKHLTEWELKFMTDIEARGQYYQLSYDQEYILESVWERVTS